MNKNLKLFMEDFNPIEGVVSYVVENELGDRVARAEYTGEEIKNYSPSTMDFFVLGFLPKLIEMGASVQVRGPISQDLKDLLGSTVDADDIVDVKNRNYSSADINFFKEVFLKHKNLNETLNSVFNYYK